MTVKGRASTVVSDHTSHVTSSFENYNRNKLSITLDLDKEEAQGIAKQLVSLSDVVVENFPPRVLRKWGLNYEELHKANPAIIMISLSAAGQWGQLQDIMTYGPSLGGLAGIEAQVGYEDNVPLGSHRDATDPMAAVFAGFEVMAALHYRNRTGKGQYLDMSQWEAGATTIGYQLMDWIMNKRNPRLVGNKHVWAAPHGSYRCRGKDRWVAMAVTMEEEWQGLCGAMSCPNWTLDPKFEDMRSRKEHEAELDGLVENWTSGLEQYDVMSRLQGRGVPCAATLDTIQTPQDPQFISRRLWTEPASGHKVEADTIVENPYWRLSRTPGGAYRPAPTLGRDQTVVLHDLLGVEADEIESLGKKGVLY